MKKILIKGLMVFVIAGLIYVTPLVFAMADGRLVLLWPVSAVWLFTCWFFFKCIEVGLNEIRLNK